MTVFKVTEDAIIEVSPEEEEHILSQYGEIAKYILDELQRQQEQENETDE